MSRSFVLVADRRQDRWFMEGSRPKSPGITGASALTFVALMIGPAFTRAGLARAAQEPKPGSQSQPDLPNAPTAFVVETGKVLKELQETLSGFATRTLASIEPDGPQEGDISSKRLMVESARAQFEAAKGAREFAHLALKEYKEGIVKQEQAALEAELKFAQDELKHATAKVDQAKERYAKIKAASNGSVYDLAQEWRFEFGDIVAELEVHKAQFKVEQTESRLKGLREHSANGNTKKLTGEVEKARSDELAKKATWELEQAKLLKLQRGQSAGPRLTDHQQRMLAILDAAIPVEERLGKKLAECERAGDADKSLRKAIEALSGRLAAFVEEGRDAEADAALATLKRNLGRSPNP
jgi:hypothetical protein